MRIPETDTSALGLVASYVRPVFLLVLVFSIIFLSSKLYSIGLSKISRSAYSNEFKISCSAGFSDCDLSMKSLKLFSRIG